MQGRGTKHVQVTGSVGHVGRGLDSAVFLVCFVWFVIIDEVLGFLLVFFFSSSLCCWDGEYLTGACGSDGTFNYLFM